MIGGSAIGAFGNECAAGTKHKKDLTGLLCSTNRADAASCQACCESNSATCGGLNPSCDSNHYRYVIPTGKTTATTAVLNAWKNLAATDTNKNTACCTKKATCASSGYTCAKGYKKKAGVTTNCKYDVASCGEKDSGCCEANPFVCGGKLIAKAGAETTATAVAPTTCAKVGTQELAMGSGSAWEGQEVYTKNKKTNKGPLQTEYEAACCIPKPTCASQQFSKSVCPKGYKKNTDQTKQCTSAENCKTTCCTADPANQVCSTFATSVVCASDRYYDARLKDTPATATTAPQKCCSAKASCAVARCPAGYQNKVSAAKTLCSGGAELCAQGTCCELNPNTCGGMSGIVCPKGFFNENLDWSHIKDATKMKAAQNAWRSKNATDATKNTNCCTEQVACALPVGTTTPAAGAAAAATTTPAAPALKFSEHRVATSGSDHAWATNTFWLAVGGFIGMGVLMAVQGLRSRTTTSDADSREVSNLLANESLE